MKIKFKRTKDQNLDEYYPNKLGMPSYIGNKFEFRKRKDICNEIIPPNPSNFIKYRLFAHNEWILVNEQRRNHLFKKTKEIKYILQFKTDEKVLKMVSFMSFCVVKTVSRLYFLNSANIKMIREVVDVDSDDDQIVILLTNKILILNNRGDMITRKIEKNTARFIRSTDSKGSFIIGTVNDLYHLNLMENINTNIFSTYANIRSVEFDRKNNVIYVFHAYSISRISLFPTKSYTISLPFYNINMTLFDNLVLVHEGMTKMFFSLDLLDSHTINCGASPGKCEGKLVWLYKNEFIINDVIVTFKNLNKSYKNWFKNLQLIWNLNKENIKPCSLELLNKVFTGKNVIHKPNTSQKNNFLVEKLKEELPGIICAYENRIKLKYEQKITEKQLEMNHIEEIKVDYSLFKSLYDDYKIIFNKQETEHIKIENRKIETQTTKKFRKGGF